MNPVALVNADDFAPLYSDEAEMSTLGSMILSRHAAEEVVAILEEEDFYRPAHRDIYRAMLQLLRNNKAIDLVTLTDELVAREKLRAVGGEDYLIQVAEFVPSPANSQYYAGIVLDKSTLRRLESAGREIVGMVRSPNESDADERVNQAERIVFEVGQRRLGTYFAPVQALAHKFFADIDRIIESGEPILGTQTGFYDLDKKLTGLYPGELSIIAARPSMGKTTLVLDMALRIARLKVGNVAIFSLEMGAVQLVRRFVSMVSSVTSYAMKQADLTQANYSRLADACEELYGLPIFIDDSSDISPLEMRGKCRRLKADGGLALIIVDYLQLARGTRRTENRVQEISDIARSLKAMAKELDVPVIALSQLNRSVESRDNKRPQLSDLRESGSIEAEADVVMMIYREQYYRDREKPNEADRNPDRVEVAEVNVAKHRNGEIGSVLLGFQPSFVRFRDLTEDSKRQYMAEVHGRGSE
ncbi:MAG: replicative DNA helicase [Fimbriimonadaceae bacterium]